MPREIGFGTQFYIWVYIAPLAFGICRTIVSLTQGHLFTDFELLLLSFTFSLLAYSWVSDTIHPGFKSEFARAVISTHNLRLFLLTFVESLSYFVLFTTNNSPSAFMVFLSGLFLFRALTTREHKNVMKQMNAPQYVLKLNNLNVLSEAVSAIILGFYSLIVNSLMPQGSSLLVAALLIMTVVAMEAYLRLTSIMLEAYERGSSIGLRERREIE